MKKINFITTLSPEKQHAIKRWFLITFFFCITSISIGLYFVLPQLLKYRALQKKVSILREKTKGYADLVKNKKSLKTDHEMLWQKTKKIDAYKQGRKNPHLHIVAIVESCSQNILLESIRFNKQECEMTIICSTAECATVFSKRLLETSLFTAVKLVSLQYEPQSKKLRAIIKGVINEK